MSTSAPTKNLIGGSWRVIGVRYGGRHPRTVKRWVDKGELPRPDVIIRERPYYYETTLDTHDRQRATEALSKPRRVQHNFASKRPPPDSAA
jgi:hypothetical protein